MKLVLVPVLLVVVALALLAIAAKRRKPGDRRDEIELKAKPLMTSREQAMYWRLKETFPNSVVLAQVAFSAMVTSEFKQRGRYDRRVADFVLCDPSTKVQVVIELDDASHKGRERQDKARDKVLVNAGYKVLRFANVPDQDDLRAYLQAQLPTQTRATASTSTVTGGAMKASRGLVSQDP